VAKIFSTGFALLALVVANCGAQAQDPRRATPQPVSPPFGGTWQVTAAAPPVGTLLNNPLLLTDGSVIVFAEIVQPGAPSTVFKLSPDAFGSYVNGTWSQIASLPSGYQPFAFASAVLPDGRVIVEGGECNSAVIACTTDSVWSNLGAIYDPVANVWTSVSPPTGPGWLNTDSPGSCNGGIGDAPGIVLPNGTFMLGASCANPPVEALFNATNLTWTSTGAPLYYQDEQGYTLLQNGKVLTIDVSDGRNNSAMNMSAETYDPATGTWSPIASIPILLTDPMNCFQREIGPAVTRADGTVVAFGGVFGSCVAAAPDPTAIYNPLTNAWTQGPYIPTINGAYYSLADAPAALLPNGNILFAASPGFHTAPVHFFEFTTANAINQIADDVYNSGTQTAEYVNFLVLPTGQILATGLGPNMEIYTPLGTPNPAWAPTITSVEKCITPGRSYLLSGTQLNGLSQGAAYGDDWQAATNYPLLKIVNSATGHVFYARTYNHSTMSIAPGQAGTTNFQVASATELGGSMLYVVTNGIPSVGQFVAVASSCAANARTHDLNGDGMSDIVWRDSSGDVAVWLMNGNQLLQGGGLGNADPSVWKIVGQRDFNGDGKADLLWNDTSGNVAIWLMNGVQVPQYASVSSAPGWTVVGTGDFNGDGKGDILFEDASGHLAIWLMNGTQISQAGGIGTLPSGWKVVGTGDFNGDGKADILFEYTSGALAIWFMNGTQVSQYGNAPGATAVWTVVGTSDFNGDGYSDILWRDNSNNLAVWLMQSTSVLQAGAVGNVGSTWNVADTGDFNGDGNSDILWRDTSGNVAMWYMNGIAVSQYLGASSAPLAWTIQGVNAD
jgi:FG-GAP-like repeat